MSHKNYQITDGPGLLIYPFSCWNSGGWCIQWFVYVILTFPPHIDRMFWLEPSRFSQCEWYKQHAIKACVCECAIHKRIQIENVCGKADANDLFIRVSEWLCMCSAFKWLWLPPTKNTYTHRHTFPCSHMNIFTIHIHIFNMLYIYCTVWDRYIHHHISAATTTKYTRQIKKMMGLSALDFATRISIRK